MLPKIIFEDEFLLVIDKPSGMVVNRAETTAKIISVQDWVEKYLPNLSSSGLTRGSRPVPETLDSRFRGNDIDNNAEIFHQRAGIVHRLDKETSGLLLIAKTPEAFTNLQAQFKNREVKKKYLSLVHGKVLPEVGEINAPVGRLPWNRERFGVMPGGKEAVTRYKVLNYYGESLRSPTQFFPVQNLTQEPRHGRGLRSSKIGGLPAIHKHEQAYSLLELSPQTGRTHQIRIHLQYLGFPIVGDTFYAGRKQALEDRKFCPRVFLHASGISFNHPISGENLEFNSPLPPDLEEILDKFL